MINVKQDKFKSEYAPKIGFTAEQIKSENSKFEVYYFSVDLKFIIKARLYMLSYKFEEIVLQSSK